MFMTRLRLSGLRASVSLHTTALAAIKRTQLPPRPKINEEEITEVFLKGGGKGGQKINKTNSKVQLKHLPTGIVVECQATRSRDQNRKKARELLALQVEKLTVPEGESRLDIVAKYKQDKARKKKQRSRKKYRELAAAKQAADSNVDSTADAPDGTTSKKESP